VVSVPPLLVAPVPLAILAKPLSNPRPELALITLLLNACLIPQSLPALGNGNGSFHVTSVPPLLTVRTCLAVTPAVVPRLLLPIPSLAKLVPLAM